MWWENPWVLAAALTYAAAMSAYLIRRWRTR